MKLFQWLAFSIRPLRLKELAKVVAVDFDSQDVPWFDRHRRYDDAEGILEVCSGFVTTTEGTVQLDFSTKAILLTGRSGKVKLAHFSVKEYFLSQPASPFYLTEPTSHLHISETCLAYLAQFDKPDSLDYNRLREEYPLARYAAEFWVSHAKAGDIDNTPHHQKLAINIFRHRHMRDNWIQIWDLDNPWLDIGMVKLLPSEIPPSIYYASHAGLGVVVRTLLENGADVNAQGGWYGNALLASSVKGHESIVKMLLENGADVNAQGGVYNHALLASSLNGHESIVKIAAR
jgi:hypothetical protein